MRSTYRPPCSSIIGFAAQLLMFVARMTRPVGLGSFAVQTSIVLAVAARAADRPDIFVADFEGRTYGDWKTTGEAFGSGPARGTLPNQMPVSGFEGRGLVNSFHNGDGTTGTLTLPEVVIQRKYINFLLGGGMHPGETCINLLVDGRVVRTATGPNDRPGGSERLDWHTWDTGDLEGKKAAIQIVDRATGGWGHINVDQIVQSDRKRQAGPASRELVIEKPYLHLPVRNGASQRRMRLVIDGRTVREFEIELADGPPDFWVFCDASPWAGKRLKIEIDRLPLDSKGLVAIVQSDQVPGADRLYKEKYRPQFHFSSRRGWNNDPNGLVYSKGEYHLFYQHNPYGWSWGNMHWGHAVSPDLVHWTELPVAIYPHQFGDWAFSGSAVVDRENTSGFKTGEEDVIVAAYTSTGRGESIAYSNDRGRTFADYQGNPVVKHGGRDPKLIWYAPGKHWVMAVYDERGSARGIAFYTSPDLKKWELCSRIDGYYECPEIFELPVDGKKAETRWVVYAADGAYAIGRFDGKVFTPESDKHRFNWGNSFYASQTFNDIPPEDGRRIQIGWGRSGHRDMPFNQMMNFPVELTLRTTDEGVRMFAVPVAEIEKLRAGKHAWKDAMLRPGENPAAGISGDLFEIRSEWTPGEAGQIGFVIRGVAVVYDVKKRQLACHQCMAPLKPAGGKITLHILVDRTSIEIFAGHGRIYMPINAIPGDDNRSLSVFAQGGTAKLDALEVYELRSAWR
jgi:fructan beta-fructosidase